MLFSLTWLPTKHHTSVQFRNRPHPKGVPLSSGVSSGGANRARIAWLPITPEPPILRSCLSWPRIGKLTGNLCDRFGFLAIATNSRSLPCLMTSKGTSEPSVAGWFQVSGFSKVDPTSLDHCSLLLQEISLLPKTNSLIGQINFPANFQARNSPTGLQATPALA